MFRDTLAFLVILTAVFSSGCAFSSSKRVVRPVAEISVGTATTPSATQPVTSVSAMVSNNPADAENPTLAVLTDASEATIIGSEEASTLLDNFTAYIAAVDTREIAAGRQGWSEPVSLSAGPHRLTVGFVRGVFNATANLEFTAQAGGAYELRHRSDAQVYGDHSYCEFWVTNKNTGEKVTGVVRVEIERLKK